MNVIVAVALVWCIGLSGADELFESKDKLIVPNIVHQIYDYQAPSFFMYLSLICVQRYIKPERHILWVNNEGQFRKNHWQGWQGRAAAGSWEKNLTELIESNKIEVKLITFPVNPPGNTSIIAKNRAHHSDFVRMSALQTMGGIYLDTDAFVINSLKSLRIHNFTLSFDNIVNPDPTAPKRCNNGVLLSAPQSTFLSLWVKEYARFNPASFDYDSSEVPYQVATRYPDLVHIEMNRISPISFGFQTNTAAESLSCGIYVAPDATQSGGIWHPTWNHKTRQFNFENTSPDRYLYEELSKKLVLHLTMSQVRGYCMMRSHLGSPSDLQKMPSLLGRIFRIALYGRDDFDYKQYYSDISNGGAATTAGTDLRNSVWKSCRSFLGMHFTPDADDKSRQQYTKLDVAL